MFDFSQLDQLARPVSGVVIGPFSGPRPLQLEDVFARVVADGWAPRRPAFGAELDRCEVGTTRGTCLEPLIFDGDEVFLDPHLTPLAGDLVSFALSARGAQVQGATSLPPGKACWQQGDRWVKLFVPYRGIADMLLEKTGNSATSTLLGGEHPDDHPVLWPVRNIARRGRILFTPDSYTSDLGGNAATVVAETSVSNVTLTTSITAIISQTVGPIASGLASSTVVVTVSGYITAQNTSPTVLVSPEMAYAINTTSGSLPAGHPFFDIYSVPTSTTVGQNFTYEQTFTLPANTSQAYYFNASVINTTNNVLKIASMVMKTEAIYR